MSGILYSRCLPRRALRWINSDDAGAYREAHELGITGCLHLRHDIGAIDLDSTWADRELASDDLVRLPGETRIGRVQHRSDNASDADANYLRKQLDIEPSSFAWDRVDASRPSSSVA